MFSMKKDFTKQDFYNMLRPNGECLEWTGCKDWGDYGLTYINGKMIKTHRLALMLEGIDVTNKHVLHSCHNPSCCNPKHLRPGTHKENMIDRQTAGRYVRGVKAKKSNLTEQDILDIRYAYNNGTKNGIIAKRYNISTAAVHKIIHRKTWSHI